jgi:serine/threonine protein phosphatase 1
MTLSCAIGDVHGRRDLLEALLDAIRAETQGRNPRIVFLGDIIDRGPDSRGCLDLVIATLDAHPGSRLILGNHEEFLLRFLDSRENRARIAHNWLSNGGAATLASYGLDTTARLDRIADDFAKGFADHVAALSAADWLVETEHYCLVHGGIEPLVPLDGQDPVTTRWIRGEFLRFRGPFEKTVVHGHTRTESARPEVHPNRIALDTGAYSTGHLTCAIFDGDARPRFLATDESGGTITVSQVAPVRFD